MLTGEEAKNKLRSTGLQMGEVAERLGMTRQNLNTHLRKDFISSSFLLLLENKFSSYFKEESNQSSNINVNSKPKQDMKPENFNIILNSMAEKIEKLEKKLSEYEQVKPNAKHAS